MANRMGLMVRGFSLLQAVARSNRSPPPNMPTRKPVIAWQKGKLDFLVIETAQNPSKEWVGVFSVCLFCCVKRERLYCVSRSNMCQRDGTRSSTHYAKKEKSRKAWHNIPKRWRPEGLERKQMGYFVNPPFSHPHTYTHMLFSLSKTHEEFWKCRNNKQALKSIQFMFAFSNKSFVSQVGVGSSLL